MRFGRRSLNLALLLALLCLPLARAATPVPAAAIDLTPYRGKIVYLDFWASWCVPCRQSFPWMESMQRNYGAQGFVVVSINVDEQRADAEQFLRRYGGDLAVKFDSGGVLAQQYGVTGMPSSFLLDRNGVVRFRHAGFRDKDREPLENQIRQMLAAP
jgi:thiol-disulfide isomerase/thioredoxin